METKSDFRVEKGIGKKWIYKNSSLEVDQNSHFNDKVFSETIFKLLKNIGLKTSAEIEKFLHPDASNLYDPYLLKGLSNAVLRLQEAIQKKQKILFYGDYDVDGTTAVAMNLLFFQKIYPYIDYYVPDRYSEGYGLSLRGLSYAEKVNAELVITLDCGIKGHLFVEEANKKGIDVIICDHHQTDKKLPKAFSILNPVQKECSYPFKGLSGCGVAFKLIQAYAASENISSEKVFDVLDLLAVSIAADIVPVIDENRILLTLGLEKINKNPSLGLKTLLKKVKPDAQSEVEISDLVFKVAPAINAAGRIAHANMAIQMLIAKDEEEAEYYVDQVVKKNNLRREYDLKATEEAVALAQGKDLTSKKSTVLYNEKWHKGVVGIVASRCIEKVYKPTIVFTKNHNSITGSARSVDGFNIFSAIDQCSEFLDSYGGHHAAAGLNLKAEKLEGFSVEFEKVVASSYVEKEFIPHLNIDLEIKLDEITFELLNEINMLSPFGPGNPRPVFVTRNLKLAEPLRVLKEEHLKLKVYQEDNKVVSFDAIGFGNAFMKDLISASDSFDMCYVLKKNVYKGTTSIQLEIKDIKTAH